MVSIVPLTAVIEQAASTLVMCFCEETVDHEANGSVFRRLVLPPHLHSCLNDSLNITVQYKAHQQRLAQQRAELNALEAQEHRAQPALPEPQMDVQHSQRDSVALAHSDAAVRQPAPRQSVVFGNVQELSRSSARSAASIYPASAMRATVRGQDHGVPEIEW